MDYDFSSFAAYLKRVQCGGCRLNLTIGSTGEIFSPNYPGDYGANVDCLWLLGAEIDARIVLR